MLFTIYFWSVYWILLFHSFTASWLAPTSFTSVLHTLPWVDRLFKFIHTFLLVHMTGWLAFYFIKSPIWPTSSTPSWLARLPTSLWLAPDIHLDVFLSFFTLILDPYVWLLVIFSLSLFPCSATWETSSRSWCHHPALRLRCERTTLACSSPSMPCATSRPSLRRECSTTAVTGQADQAHDHLHSRPGTPRTLSYSSLRIAPGWFGRHRHRAKVLALVPLVAPQFNPTSVSRSCYPDLFSVTIATGGTVIHECKYCAAICPGRPRGQNDTPVTVPWFQRI